MSLDSPAWVVALGGERPRGLQPVLHRKHLVVFLVCNPWDQRDNRCAPFLRGSDENPGIAVFVRHGSGIGIGLL